MTALINHHIKLNFNFTSVVHSVLSNTIAIVRVCAAGVMSHLEGGSSSALARLHRTASVWWCLYGLHVLWWFMFSNTIRFLHFPVTAALRAVMHRLLLHQLPARRAPGQTIKAALWAPARGVPSLV